MKKFLVLVVTFSLPLFTIGILISVSYFYFDPFKVVKKYPEFYSSVVGLNEDYVATERYLKTRTTNHYNSFVLGSSRAGSGFNTNHWEEKLGKNDHAFLYAASNENIYGIFGKLRLIDDTGDSIKNVLLIICSDITFASTKNNKGHLFIKHPLVSRESNKSFQQTNLKDYIFTGFFFPYLDYQLFKTRRPYMEGFLKFDQAGDTITYVPFQATFKESKIKKNERKHYENVLFYERPAYIPPYEKQIHTPELHLLNEINALFRKHHTNYKIIISPLYNQKKINPEDLEVLYSLFGRETVFDFSGKNDITDNKFNYYEKSHYRFHIGDSIINRIYNRSDSVSYKRTAY